MAQKKEQIESVASRRIEQEKRAGGLARQHGPRQTAQQNQGFHTGQVSRPDGVQISPLAGRLQNGNQAVANPNANHGAANPNASNGLLNPSASTGLFHARMEEEGISVNRGGGPGG